MKTRPTLRMSPLTMVTLLLEASVLFQHPRQVFVLFDRHDATSLCRQGPRQYAQSGPNFDDGVVSG